VHGRRWIVVRKLGVVASVQTGELCSSTAGIVPEVYFAPSIRLPGRPSSRRLIDPQRPVQVRMMLRPLDVEDAPALVDLGIAAPTLNCLCTRSRGRPGDRSITRLIAVLLRISGSRFRALR
jgi:hypothetical protein